jgi:hypothetical protein
MRLCFGVTGATDRGAALLICESFCHPCHFSSGPRGSELQRFHEHASGLTAPKSDFKGLKAIGTKLAHFAVRRKLARRCGDVRDPPVAVAESPAGYGFAAMTNIVRRAWDGTLGRARDRSPTLPSNTCNPCAREETPADGVRTGGASRPGSQLSRRWMKVNTRMRKTIRRAWDGSVDRGPASRRCPGGQ